MRGVGAGSKFRADRCGVPSQATLPYPTFVGYSFAYDANPARTPLPADVQRPSAQPLEPHTLL